MSSKPMDTDKLNDELLGEILHNLPFDFLLQCKSVSKQFHRVISHPLFIRSHPSHRQLLPNAFEPRRSFLFFHFHSESSFHKIMLLALDSNNKTYVLRGSDFLPSFLSQDFERVRVKATHYDLVLCSTHNQSYTHYFVCNPFTKQYVALPPISKIHAHEMARVGFIYDQSQSRFGVVHIPINCFENVTSFQANLFLSHTGEWSASTVTIPFNKTLMANTFYRSILVCNGKFVWWVKEHGFFVCDPFNAEDTVWRIIPTTIPHYWFDGSINMDMCNGICNGLVKVCRFFKMDSVSIIYALNLETGKWSRNHHIFNHGVCPFNNMKLLALHPQNESMIFVYLKKTVFLCDYQNQRLEPVYTTTDEEDLRVSDNVMSLVLPRWPTLVPTLANIQN